MRLGPEMRVLCAWCEREGTDALIREVEPFEDRTATHGICARHYNDLLAQLRSERIRGLTAGPLAAPAVTVPEPERIAGRVDAQGVPDVHGRLAAWLREGQDLLGTSLAQLAGRRAQLERRCAAADEDVIRFTEALRQRRAEIRDCIAANQRMRVLRGEIGDVVKRLIDQTLTETLRPLYHVSERLRGSRSVREA